ncbi:MAG: hypothetical protein WC631_02750 [Candidatus Paceibacterota bacterium]|jgi:hypothetical protein
MARRKKIDEEEKVVGNEPEETDGKTTAALSDGVLEAFDDESPTGLEDEDKLLEEEEEDDEELSELDFRTSDDW